MDPHLGTNRPTYFWLFLARHHLFGSYHCLGKGGFVSLSRTGDEPSVIIDNLNIDELGFTS